MALYSRESVIKQVVQRTEERVDDSSVRGVRCQESRDRSKADDEAYNKDCQYGITQPFLLRRMGVSVLFRFFPCPTKDILHDAERANDGAVYSSED